MSTRRGKTLNFLLASHHHSGKTVNYIFDSLQMLKISQPCQAKLHHCRNVQYFFFLLNTLLIRIDTRDVICVRAALQLRAFTFWKQSGEQSIMARL